MKLSSIATNPPASHLDAWADTVSSQIRDSLRLAAARYLGRRHGNTSLRRANLDCAPVPFRAEIQAGSSKQFINR